MSLDGFFMVYEYAIAVLLCITVAGLIVGRINKIRSNSRLSYSRSASASPSASIGAPVGGFISPAGTIGIDARPSCGVDEPSRLVNVYVIENNEPAIFDLIPDKHGHFLDEAGTIHEVNGARVTVPLFSAHSGTLFNIIKFVDEMEGTHTHERVTIVIKESLSLIGAYSV
jgi:hypothetical protein